MVSRTWCFTLNNYEEDDIKRIKSIDFTRLVVGKEVAASGTPHLQGFVTLAKAARLTRMKRLHPKAHWEVARSVEASVVYCKKEGDYEEYVRPKKKVARAPVSLPRVPSVEDIPSIPDLPSLKLF